MPISTLHGTIALPDPIGQVELTIDVDLTIYVDRDPSTGALDASTTTLDAWLVDPDGRRTQITRDADLGGILDAFSDATLDLVTELTNRAASSDSRPRPLTA